MARESFPPVRSFRVTPSTPLTGSIDEEARIRSVPTTMTAKGMYLADLVGRVDPEVALAIWPKLQETPRGGQYQRFRDYPYADAMRWVHAVAHKEFPGESLLQGMRLLGRDTVRVFLTSTVGRVVKGMSLGARPTLLRLPEIWKITDPQSEASADDLPDGRVRFHLRGFPGWMDCGLIGAIEQVVMNYASDAVIDVALTGMSEGVFEITIVPRGSAG